MKIHKTYDWLIVGAGFTGCVMAERLASQLDQRVLLIDRRSHIGGNAYDCYDENGILIHKYGPHIFHTNSVAVWNYLSQFTEWQPYEHRVLAEIGGRHVPLPFSLASLDAVFSREKAAALERLLLAAYGAKANVPILRMLEHEDEAVRELGDYVYRNVFENYTLKQWGLRPEQLGPGVTGRVPVRVSRDTRYFQDTYQAMPTDGFTPMFERMVTHPNITVELNCDFAHVNGSAAYRRMVYTGPIDEFFGYTHGPLPYRSLRLEFRFEECDQLQPVAVVNYPNEHAYTRVTEFKHLTGQQAPGTTTVREYPEAYVPGTNEPYYPVPIQASAAIYEKYDADARALDGTVLFAGRLGDYKYYNMDQAVARALSLSRSITAETDRGVPLTISRGGIAELK